MRIGVVTTHLSHSNGYLIAGMLISWVAFLAASVALYRLVAAYGLDWLRTRHALRWDVLALALTPWGLALYAAYCFLRFGDPLAYMKASVIGWHGSHFQLGGLQQLAVILTHPGALNSLGRHLSVAFPVFIVLAYALRERPLWRDVTLIGFTIFLGIFALAYAGGYGLS